MHFPAHGEISIKWLGNILIVSPSGSVNEMGAMRFHHYVDQAIAEKKFRHWARIFNYEDDYCLGTPKSYLELKKHLKSTINKGCMFVGVVGGNSLNREIFQKTLDDIGMANALFSTLSTAITYIKSNIDNISTS